ncbi:mannitol dehydrogenase family protein [Catellatospora sichuanensis]|uniref:mannitol dehydrogenase family protein n=1 Tax=Catellatospora sichuanensis TaxID=1969805 RepID=UPI0011821262|nr:mannitol dehydrogenase family protein [Catellatospora sichuanensis]
MAMTVPATRLGRATLSRLPADSRPAVLPGEARSGVLHLGLGAFFRAHQAVYIEAAMAARGGDWGIVAVAPRSRDVLEALRAQDHLYSVVTLDAAAERARVMGALNGTVHAASDPDAVVGLLADPAIRVVTLTVTEKAYAPDAAVPRLLVDGLIARARADTGPITLLSCDNLPSNGVVLGNLLGGMIPAELRDWYDVSVRCPSSMVDRIVPATTAGTLASAERCLGARDLAAVAAEPFSQWVIEDDFAGAHPDWVAGGAVLTGDVTPWEHLKLRALNGVHSAMAYLGALAGCESIADALALPGMADLLRRYVATEVAASMTPPDGVTVAGYGDAALERFANARLGHRCLQVAMDGTQKLPQRVLSVLNTVADPALATLILAAWARFAEGTGDAGQALSLDDPLAARVRADLSTETLFGPGGVLEVPDPARRRMIEAWRTALATHGAADVVRTALR